MGLKRTDNESRGGTINYFRDPDWPVARILQLGFSGICDATVPDIFDFLADSLGAEVGLLDWIGQQWRGIIIDPGAHMVTQGRENDNSLAMTFRGVIV